MKVLVEFTVKDEQKFLDSLRVFENDDNVPGFRTGITRAPTEMPVFLPAELHHLEPVIHRFFDAMVYKLRRNAHKPSFETLDLEQSLKHLNVEVQELIKAMAEGNQAEILLESADVANFALILASIAIEGRKRPT